MTEGALRRDAWRALLAGFGWQATDGAPDDLGGADSPAVLLDTGAADRPWLPAAIDRLTAPAPRAARLVAVVASDLPRDHLLFQALARAGADAVLDVDAPAELLDRALRGAAGDADTVSERPAPPLALTAAERRVAAVLAARHDSRHAMARELGIAVSTLDVHVQSIKAVVRALLTERGGLANDGALTTERLGWWLRERGYGTFLPPNP